MRRALFTILSAMSLIVCLASVGMWVRTGVKGDLVTWEKRNGDSWTLVSALGRVKLERKTYELTRKVPAWWLIEEDAMSSSMVTPESRWPAYHTQTKILGSGSVTQRAIIIPYWSSTLAGAILPGLWVWRRWKQKRDRKAGLCQKCGYDLRASPVRCPECGTAVPSPATSPASPVTPSPSDPA